MSPVLLPSRASCPPPAAREAAPGWTGRAALAIPGDAMHSLEAPHNKIVWVIRVHGDIARWPDVNEEFSLMVLPHGTAGGVA